MHENRARSGSRGVTVLLCSALAITMAWAPDIVLAQAAPVGDQFQVNTYITSTTTFSTVASAPNGNFMVVWQGYGLGSDTDLWSIQGHLLDSGGVSLTGQFQLNTYTTSAQGRPAVAATPDNEFVVVWQSYGSSDTDISGYSIQAMLLGSDGNPLSGEIQVNTFTTSIQKEAAVAVQDDGSFIVVWSSNGSDGTDSAGLSIQAQRFAANGIPEGLEFQVNSYTTGLQEFPDVETIGSTDFVVVWQGPGAYGPDTSGLGIQAQRYESDGTALGGEFQMNSYTANDQYTPAVAGDDNGNFVVVWSSFGSAGGDISGSSIQGRRFDSSGMSIGTDFQINTTTLDDQKPADVSVFDNGDVVVTWTSETSSGTDSSNTSIQGQTIQDDGTFFGGEFQVNTYTTASQRYPAVSAQGNDFVVVWTSYGSFGPDNSSSSVQGQRFRWQIFADGFESGNTSAWSSTFP